MKITIIQHEIRWEDKTGNLNHLSEMIDGIGHQTDLVILPETFNTGFSMNIREMSEEMNSDTFDWMKSIARRKNIAICGSFFVRDGLAFHNRFVFVDSSGNSLWYDKRHLFSIGGEGALFTRGNERTIINCGDLRINPVVCYDLRFPVWLRNRGDYDLLICVANWPESRREVWNTLLKARAIENQSFVAGVNCTGTDNAGNSCAGESVIYDPKGKAIITLPEFQEGIATAEISLKELEDFRIKFPAWKDADNFTIHP